MKIHVINLILYQLLFNTIQFYFSACMFVSLFCAKLTNRIRIVASIHAHT